MRVSSAIQMRHRSSSIEFVMEPKASSARRKSRQSESEVGEEEEKANERMDEDIIDLRLSSHSSSLSASFNSGYA